MTWAGFVADLQARAPDANIRFAVEVIGIPYVFTSDAFDATAFTSLFGANRSALRCLTRDSVEVGEYRLDTKQRRVTSATARFDVALDDGGIVQSLITPRAKPIARIKEQVNTAETLIDCTLASRADLPLNIYIGGESLRATVWTGSQITAVRGQYGTTAQEHYGGTDGAGADVFAAPQSWANRRVRVWCYLMDDRGLPPADAAAYGTAYSGRISDMPTFANGVWSFNLEHDSERIANIECGLGLREISVMPELQDELEPSRVYIPATDLALFSALSDEFSFAVSASESGSIVASIASVGADYVELVSSTDNLERVYNQVSDMSREDQIAFGQSFNAQNLKSIRHACRLQGDPAWVALVMLSSIVGDQAFINEDLLPGNARTTYGGPQYRFGAGLGVDDGHIDTDQFKALIGLSPVPWDVLIDRPIKVGEVLQELCTALGLFWYLEPTSQNDSKIKFATMSDRDYASTSTATITKSDTVVDKMPVASIEQGPALSSVTIKASWDALVGKHLAVIESVDWEIKNQFGDDAEAVVITANMASVNVESVVPAAQLNGALKRTGGVDIGTVESMLRRIQRESVLTRQFFDVTLPIHWLSVSIGDVVTYTDDRMPNGEGGTVSGALCRVVGSEPDWVRGVVTLRLMLTRAGWRFSPSAWVTNWNAGTKTLSLSASWDGKSSPGLSFPAGCELYLTNTATGETEFAVVDSSTSTTVVLTAVPSVWTYTANECFIWFDGGGFTAGGYISENLLHQNNQDANESSALNSEWG
jgi:hypothetical protein